MIFSNLVEYKSLSSNRQMHDLYTKFIKIIGSSAFRVDKLRKVFVSADDNKTLVTDGHERKAILLVTHDVPVDWIAEYRGQQRHADEVK